MQTANCVHPLRPEEAKVSHRTLDLAREVIAAEMQALEEMSARLDKEFEKAVEAIMETRGRVIVVGMGKSGIIAKKIAATLASTGTTSFFVHPGEAYHGDLGMIRPSDTLILISNSGETEEVIRLIPVLQYQGNRVIAMTGKVGSTLAKNAHVVLDVSVQREACNNNLAPTSSTTATLVMGDALAVALATVRNFQAEDFARFHPGGSLGRKLLTRIRDVMHTRNLPICSPETPMGEVLDVITSGRMGIALVVANERMCGVITDGDLRRALQGHAEAMSLRADEIMSACPHTAAPNERFAEAEDRMRQLRVKMLVVVDEKSGPLGIVGVFDA